MDKNTTRHVENKYRFHVARDDLFVDLNLIQFGWERCDPLHEFGPAVRNHFLFHYVIDGKGKLDKGGKTYEIGKGQGFLICPGEITSYFADYDDPWIYTWIEFDGLRARQTLTLAGLSETQPIYTSIDPEGKAIQEAMMQIVNEAEDSSPLRLAGLGLVFLDELVRTSKDSVAVEKKKLRDFYIREAINFIEGNYMHDIAVEQIADSSGLNRSYFSRIFKSTVGESPQKFLLKYRMNKAAEFLKYTEMSIGDVSSSVGYENQLHFSRAFKNIFDISPSGYRNLHHVERKSNF